MGTSLMTVQISAKDDTMAPQLVRFNNSPFAPHN
jgi:hypothetical protein